MVPKLHAKGSSFKGAAAYLLHDKDHADTSERLAWTETRNLAVNDPDLAWRIMAATALDQARLKENAGVKSTGRKSDKHVLHLTLSWHPEQEPDRAEMVRAADGALAALGAEDRQTMIIAHSDEEHPHIHLLINRVSPEDGRHLSSSKEKLKLSEWAQAYEQETGIYCENRIINNERRDKGEYVRGEADQARHIYEEMRDAAVNDNDAAAEVREAQKAKDHALALRGRNLARQQAGDRARLDRANETRKAALSRALKVQIAKAEADTLEAFRPTWTTLNKRQRAERETFAALEESFFGRASNMARTIRLTGQDVGDGKSGVISRAFRILTNAGERRAYFERAQDRARKALERDQASEAAEARQALLSAHSAKLATLRRAYLDERSALLASQEAAQAELKAGWKTRTAERRAAYAAVSERADARRKLQSDYGAAASPAKGRRDALIERQARVLEFRKASQPRTREQDNSKDRDRSED